jgi:hypothetical protein
MSGGGGHQIAEGGGDGHREEDAEAGRDRGGDGHREEDGGGGAGQRDAR